MSEASFPPLDVTAQWGCLNDSIVTLVDYVPDDKLDWSPQPDLWNFRGILLHTVMTRDNWLGSFLRDGATSLDEPEAIGSFIRSTQSKADIQRELRRSWDRLGRFLSDPLRLAASYTWGERAWGGDGSERTGHWVAFHLLEHDIHHRADIFHYLALLGIEHPDVGTP